jgi:hypothetical protein
MAKIEEMRSGILLEKRARMPTGRNTTSVKERELSREERRHMLHSSRE